MCVNLAAAEDCFQTWSTFTDTAGDSKARLEWSEAQLANSNERELFLLCVVNSLSQ